MKPEQINIAIAEACGPKLFVLHKPICDPFGYYRSNAQGYTGNLDEAWKVTEDVARRYISKVSTCVDRVIMEPAPIPVYTKNLNAMHEAWMMLNDGEKRRFRGELNNIVLRDTAKEVINAIDLGERENATAAQRAEAFLKTIGKWVEE